MHPSHLPSAKVRFAHRSERSFAVLLDLHGVAWRYEPVEFPLAWHPDGSIAQGFRPDFWLPQQEMFIELTTAAQRLVTRKNRKVRQFRALYPEFSLKVVYQREFFALLSANGLDSEVGVAA